MQLKIERMLDRQVSEGTNNSEIGSGGGRVVAVLACAAGLPGTDESRCRSSSNEYVLTGLFSARAGSIRIESRSITARSRDAPAAVLSCEMIEAVARNSCPAISGRFGARSHRARAVWRRSPLPDEHFRALFERPATWIQKHMFPAVNLAFSPGAIAASSHPPPDCGWARAAASACISANARAWPKASTGAETSGARSAS